MNSHVQDDEVRLPIHSCLRAYQYRPLDSRTGEIRLVKILPGHFDDRLQIHLEHVPLVATSALQDERLSFPDLLKTVQNPWRAFKNIDGRYIFYNMDTETTQWEHPDPDFPVKFYHSEKIFRPPRSQVEYEALSYAWGNDAHATDVEVVGALAENAKAVSSQVTWTLPIRPNLLEALKHLRYASRPRTLWVDAISINQNDMDERSGEVKRMGRIYTLASRVVVWLGPASHDDSSGRALELLDYLGQQMEYVTSFAFLRTPGAKEPDWYDYDIKLPFDTKDYAVIEEILDRSWWKRLWIWQEIHLANQSTIVQCGPDQIPWSNLRRAIMNLHAREHPSHPSFRALVESAKHLSMDNKGEDVLQLLLKTRHALYSAPHDRIFALLGLLDSEFVQRIRSDYSLPLNAVYEDVCVAILHQSNHVNFLEYCDLDYTAAAGLPSWVPNWSVSQQTKHFDIGFASGRSAVNESHQDTPGVLNITGILCGKIDEVGLPMPASGDSRDTLRSWQEQFTNNWSEEQFLTALLGSLTDERWPDRGYSTIRENRDVYKKFMGGADERIFRKPISRYTRCRRIFQTQSHLGLAPSAAQFGDALCVVLGCNYPLVLRHCRDTGYQVVGPAYVYDLMNGEALLGPLPAEWKVHYEVTESGYDIQVFTNQSDGTRHLNDPRLGALPPSWSFAEAGRSEAPEFRHAKISVAQWNDPRLTVAELKARGVALERLRLL